VKRAVADVATAKKRIEIQAETLKTQGDKLAEQAKAALAQGNEPLAREALTRREAIASQLKDLETQHASVDDQLQKLEATATKLQTEIEAFRTKKETIKATYTAAEASAHVNEAVSGISTSMGDAGAAMQRAQDKVAQMQARSGALDELLASGALTDLTNTRRHPGPARQGVGPVRHRRAARGLEGDRHDHPTARGDERRTRRSADVRKKLVVANQD
jgi:phage shock protein A